MDYRNKPFKYRVLFHNIYDGGNKCFMYSKETRVSVIRKRIEELSRSKKVVSIEVNRGIDSEYDWQISKLQKEFGNG